MIKNKKITKKVGAHEAHLQARGRRLCSSGDGTRHPKNIFLLCYQKRVLNFLVMWFVSLVVVWFVASMFFFLYLLQNLQFDFFVVGNFLSVFILLVYSFFFVFLQKFYLFSTSSFNFNLPNIIFSNLVLILLNFQAFCEIDFFLISHFNKKFVFIFYFNFDFQYFDSFLGSFIQLIFLFKYTFQSKIKFVLYCNFDSCFFNCHLFFVLDPFMQLIFFFQVPFMQLIFFFQVNPLLFNWLRTAFRSCFR